MSCFFPGLPSGFTVLVLWPGPLPLASGRWSQRCACIETASSPTYRASTIVACCTHTALKPHFLFSATKDQLPNAAIPCHLQLSAPDSVFYPPPSPINLPSTENLFTNHPKVWVHLVQDPRYLPRKPSSSLFDEVHSLIAMDGALDCRQSD